MNWSCPECGARKDDFEMVAGIEDELQVLRPMCARRDAENNSQLERAWKAEQIEMFGPKKVWAK